MGATPASRARDLLRRLAHCGKPSDERQPVEFATLVAADLPPSLARDALRVTRTVFGLLEKELDRDETDRIMATLPHPLRVRWPAPISQETPPL